MHKYIRDRNSVPSPFRQEGRAECTMNDDYKASKEAFVSGMTGSSVGHINMVSLVSLVSGKVFIETGVFADPSRSQ